MSSPETAYGAALQYLRSLKLNEEAITEAWARCARAIANRAASFDELTDFVVRQFAATNELPVLLSSRASAAQLEAESWADRADSDAASVLLLADRMLRRLHAAAATGDPMDWAAGESVGVASTSQVILAACNAIRHSDEWSSMLMANGDYDKTHRNFKRASRSIAIIQAALKESQAILEPRSADILCRIAQDDCGEPSHAVIYRRLASVALSQVRDPNALLDELAADWEYSQADFDFIY